MEQKVNISGKKGVRTISGKERAERKQQVLKLYKEGLPPKAIKRACNFGENGLPKIGIGDWNDGFSNIGTEGKGESVWLGFFLYIILKEFSKLIKQCKQEEIETSNWYENIAEKLKEI